MEFVVLYTTGYTTGYHRNNIQTFKVPKHWPFLVSASVPFSLDEILHLSVECFECESLTHCL